MGRNVAAAVGLLLGAFAASEAIASCAPHEAYAFPPPGTVLPDPTLYAENVVRVVDALGADLPFAEVPFGVKITAAPGTAFSLEFAGGPGGSAKRVGPYQVSAPDSSPVAPVRVVHVDRFSSGSPDPVRAAVLTVAEAADAYELEIWDPVDGGHQTRVVPARRAQYWGGVPALPAYLDLGFIDCRSNFEWIAPTVRVQVAALRSDGRKSSPSAPVVIRAPLPSSSGRLAQLADLLVEQPAPFAAAVAVVLFSVALIVLRVRARTSR